MLAIMDGYDGRRARPITTAPKTVPIGDYGFLSDGEALALALARRGPCTGCACLGWTPRACLAGSSAATRAASESRRPTSRFRPLGVTCPEP